jgi:hypothetical protein
LPMQVSLQSTVYLGTCVAINAYAAYSNPARWVTCFALGVLAGTISGRPHLQAAREGNSNSIVWDADRDQNIREHGVKSLTKHPMPNMLETVITLIALGLISQRDRLPSGWNPNIGFAIGAYAVFLFGSRVTNLYMLNILRRDQNLTIQELLNQTTI